MALPSAPPIRQPNARRRPAAARRHSQTASKTDRDQRQGNQRVTAEIAVRAQHRIGDAAIPAHGQSEKGRQRDNRTLRPVEQADRPEFAGLIERQRQSRDAEAEQAPRGGRKLTPTGPAPAIRARPARRAASRREIPDRCRPAAKSATSARICAPARGG